MGRELKKHQLVEQSITKRFRRELWNQFVQAVKDYGLVGEDSRICVPIDGSAQSVLTAKLMQHLKRISPMPFELVITGTRDYSEIGITYNQDNADYDYIVAFECMDDVIETTFGNILKNGKIASILPREGNIIRPLYCISRHSISSFVRYNGLDTPVIGSADPDIAELIDDMENRDEGIKHSMFRSVHSLSLDTMVGYTQNGAYHSFLDNYE